MNCITLYNLIFDKFSICLPTFNRALSFRMNCSPGSLVIRFRFRPSTDKERGAKFIWAVRKRLLLRQAKTLFTGIEQLEHNRWAILNREGKKTYWISLKEEA